MSQGREQIIEARDVRDSQSIRDSQTSQFQGSQSQSARDSQSRTSIPIPEEDNPNYRSRWERTSFIGMLHFTHIIPFFRRVRAKIKKNHEITLDDAPRLGKTERVEYFDDRLYENYQSQRKSRPNKPASIVRAIIKTFSKEVIFQFIYQALFFGLRLVYGYFLHELLMALNDGSTSVREGYRKAIGLFVSLVVSMYASQQAYFNNYNLVTKTKAAVISLIYKKINKVSLYSLNQLSMGKIINIVANDINSFDKFFNIFALCLMPFVFGGGIAILCTFYGAVCLTGFAFIFLTFPLQMKLAKSSSPARKEKNRLTDERVKFTNEIIESIRLLKMYAWELAFKQRVEDIRENEIKILRRLAYTEGAQRVLAFSAISGSSFIIFLSYVLTGGTLNVGLVFSTVFLMQVVAMYGVFIPAIGIAFLIESKLTFKRIEQIFDLPEIKVFKHKAPVDPDNAVEYRKFSGYWDVPDGDTLNQQIKNQLVMQARASKSVEEAREALKQVRMASAQSLDLQDKPQRDIIEDKGVLDEKHIRKPPLIKKTETHVEKAVLKDINLDIKAKSLTAIVGRVGSGKSTLLLSLTGEMPRLEGSIRFSGKIAYVEQEPIIFSGTIRENITFGLEYEPDFYSQVVRASSLLSDFRQFPLKDLTEIGEKGITLSGGQKARVALARALYSRADIYLLDDPLSAVDTKVAKRLYEDAIRKFLRDKTVLLATHQVHFVRDAEKIIIMDEGEILASGTYDELQQGGFQLEAIAEEVKEAVPQHQVHKPEDHVELEEEAMTNDRQDEANLIHEEGGLFGKEDVESGRVSWATYKRFLKLSLTRYRGTLLFVLLIGTEILNIAYGRIIGLWGQGELERDVALGVAGGLALAAYIFFFTKIVLYTQATLRGSKKLHNGMLSVIIRNKVEFFDTNPVGRILNRFSHDVGIMDRMLPQYLLDILEGNTYLLALFIAIWAINPWVIFTGVATIIGFFFVIKITTPVVVHSRQLELISRSPLYSFFSMTLCGLIAVRSFGQSDNFMKKFTGMVNIFLKTNFAFWHASRFMSMLIDYTSSLGALAGLCIIIGTKNSKEPDLIGQSALYILLLNEQIQWILRQTINVNLFMASAARIIDYTDNTKVEAPLELPSDAELIRAGWPQQGQIDFDHVYMKYRQNTEHVVKDLTFKVKPGEKIGCVGRTGAGKSSILQILFRMVEIDKTLEGVETKLDIDQKDVANIGLHTLRKNISIIPQTPVLFTGTIRRNLDPFGVKTDEELWTALNEVNLKEHVEKLEGKMETDLTNANQTFSVGQKQLICLARAILKRSKIIVLDEATANVDFETDHFIQAKIMEKFNDCTVFTIAHRLSTIANYDKVLVMDKGRLAEFDAPYRLLVEKEGDNQITKENGVFASMVQNTGETASRHIFEVAKEKFASQQPEGMIPTEITIRNKSS